MGTSAIERLRCPFCRRQTLARVTDHVKHVTGLVIRRRRECGRCGRRYTTREYHEGRPPGPVPAAPSLAEEVAHWRARALAAEAMVDQAAGLLARRP